MMQIQDPIHGYIELEGMFADIVNTPEFQRLRSIEQGSFRPVYPGARHDRFIHSLGVYHLAGKFVDCFFANLKKDAGITLSPDEENLLKNTLRYAALLHDIGHAPFSHTTEDFFREPKISESSKTPIIWQELCDAVAAVNPSEAQLFQGITKPSIGAAHEIVSATILVSEHKTFGVDANCKSVDLPLAARMVIGHTYTIGDLNVLQSAQPNMDIHMLGIRNCLIQLLNSSLLDVDRLDYLVRDTQMSGFVNAPLDLARLATSVTAIKLEDGMLVPGYHHNALSVFDLMFQAKLSHDTWVLANPAGPYDAALLAHCIRELNTKIDKNYTKTVFSRKALSRDGVTLNGKTYRLLNDVDVGADLRAQSGGTFDELWTRQLGRRRIAAWRSYYEFHHIFNDPAQGVTPEGVFHFFQPLLSYLKDHHIFIFDYNTYTEIRSGSGPAAPAAEFLHNYLSGLATEKQNKGNAESSPTYNVVLLDRINNLTAKLDPAQIRIVFPNDNTPLRAGKFNYSTYQDLTGVSTDDIRIREYFYLYRHGGLGHVQLEQLRSALAEHFKNA